MNHDVVDQEIPVAAGDIVRGVRSVMLRMFIEQQIQFCPHKMLQHRSDYGCPIRFALPGLALLQQIPNNGSPRSRFIEMQNKRRFRKKIPDPIDPPFLDFIKRNVALRRKIIQESDIFPHIADAPPAGAPAFFRKNPTDPVFPQNGLNGPFPESENLSSRFGEKPVRI